MVTEKLYLLYPKMKQIKFTNIYAILGTFFCKKLLLQMNYLLKSYISIAWIHKKKQLKLRKTITFLELEMQQNAFCT